MKEKSEPPYCRLAIKWEGEPRPKLPNVSRKVKLEGAKEEEDENYFSIQLPARGNLNEHTNHAPLKRPSFLRCDCEVRLA